MPDLRTRLVRSHRIDILRETKGWSHDENALQAQLPQYARNALDFPRLIGGAGVLQINQQVPPMGAPFENGLDFTGTLKRALLTLCDGIEDLIDRAGHILHVSHIGVSCGYIIGGCGIGSFHREPHLFREGGEDGAANICPYRSGQQRRGPGHETPGSDHAQGRPDRD
jgi:hypothetical protein